MPKTLEISDSKTKSRAATLKDIRQKMGRTQNELATALGCSSKAIQSYEQGWRPIPVRTMIQLLVLLALHRKEPGKHPPCWEIMHCKIDIRKKCPAFTVSRGQFCWFVAAKTCRPRTKDTQTAIWQCMDCKVVRTMLKSSDIEKEGAG